MSSNNTIFKIVYTDNDMWGLCDGDYYFDTRDNTYYIYNKMGSIEISTTLSSVSNTFSQNYTISSNIITYDRENLKEYLKSNPELLDELICDLRKEKINKLRNK